MEQAKWRGGTGPLEVVERKTGVYFRYSEETFKVERSLDS